MEGHHLILGELVDAITGQVLPDTHDERYRQKLARLLMDDKGYFRTDIQSRCSLQIKAGENRALVKVDMAVTLADKICMIIKYPAPSGPGSITAAGSISDPRCRGHQWGGCRYSRWPYRRGDRQRIECHPGQGGD